MISAPEKDFNGKTQNFAEISFQLLYELLIAPMKNKAIKQIAKKPILDLFSIFLLFSVDLKFVSF